MVNFEVGDRVRLLKNGYCEPIVKGLGGVVIDVGSAFYGSPRYYVKLDIDYKNYEGKNYEGNNSWPFYRSELELEGENK